MGRGDPDAAKCAGIQIALATRVIIYKRTLRAPTKENALVLTYSSVVRPIDFQ